MQKRGDGIGATARPFSSFSVRLSRVFWLAEMLFLSLLFNSILLLFLAGLLLLARRGRDPSRRTPPRAGRVVRFF